jgi:hypothetical protein
MRFARNIQIPKKMSAGATNDRMSRKNVLSMTPV